MKPPIGVLRFRRVRGGAKCKTNPRCCAAQQKRTNATFLARLEQTNPPRPAGGMTVNVDKTMKLPFDPQRHQLDVSRRTFLARSAYGLGGIALATLLSRSAPLLAAEQAARFVA